MKKFKAILISAISALGLASCSFQDVMTAVKDGTTGVFDKVKDVFDKDKDEGEPKTCSHVDEGKDHVCDLCGEAMGEHKDSDGDGKCDYCAQDIPSVGSVKFENAPTTIMVGKTVKLTAVANAVGGASSKVKYSISEGTAATVDSNGNLTGVSLGTVVVKATSIVDSSKFATISVEVVEPNWSAESVQLMEENLGGVVLPYLGTSWSEAELDEDEGLLFFESDTGDLDALKTLLEEAGFSVSKVNFTVDQKGNTAPGLSISKEVEGVGVAEAQLIDYTSYGYGFELYAYFEEFMQWPAEKLAEFIGDHTETTIPVADGDVLYASIQTQPYSAFIIDVNGDHTTYMTALEAAGYTGGLTQYGYYDFFSADHLLEVVLFPQSGSFEIQVLLSEPPATEWSAAAIQLMSEQLHGVVIPFLGPTWSDPELDDGYIYTQSATGDLDALKTLLEEAGFSVSKVNFTVDQKGNTAPGLSISKEVEGVGVAEAQLIDYTSYGYGFELYAYFEEFMQWPAQELAEFIGDHTETTIPVPVGKVVDAYEQPESEGYSAYIIDLNGDYQAYLTTLQAAGYTGGLTQYGYYDFFSADNLLEVVLFPQSGSFEIQVILAEPPAAEWPTGEVAAFCEGYTEVEIPAAEGEEFYVQSLNPAESYGYFGVIQVIGGTCSEYLTTLQSAGFTVQHDETNDFYFAIKDNLELDVFDETGYFAIQATVYVDPTIWPAETIAAFLKGHTDVEVPAASGDSYIAQASTGYYYGLAIVYGGVVADYCSTLEGAGFEVFYDEQNECYTAFKGDLAIDIYEDSTYMGLGFHTYVAPVAEWPAETIAELLEGKTEVTIPEAEGTSFTVEPLTGLYFGSITISGDMNAYLSVLEGAGFSVTWDTEFECYVAAKDNLLMDIGENPDDTSEFQMLLYLKAAFPTEDVAEAVQALVPGSETVVPEFEADEYQLQDARVYIGGFVLYASGDSSLLNEYTGILDEAGWAVSELEEGVYGAVSPAEDIMLQVFYDDDYGELDIYILTYTKPATEWPADEVAALVESIEADGTVPAADGLSFTCYEAEGYYPAQINVDVEEGTAEAAAAAYVAQLEEAGFFVVLSSYGYDYYAEEGNTLALCVYAYGDDTFIIELGCLAEPAVKPLEGWPTDDVAALVASLDVEGSAVPEFEGEGISFSTQEASTYYGPLVKINAGANDPEGLIEDYCAKLEGLGYFVAGDNYGAPVYALEGETLGISPYEDYNYGLVVELIKLSEPAVKPVPAAFPTEAVEAFFDGKTDEVVPEMVAYGFEASDKTSYLEIKAEGGNVKDYMKVLSDAGWTADYDSSAYYNYANSPEGSIKMTLINYTSYVTLKLEYVPPKLTEWPADAIAEALGEKAKTTLPGIIGEGLQFEFTDNGDDSMKLDVYGSTPTAYISILEDAGFTVTEGSEEDQYWYLLSADKTVKVQVYDYMSVGQDYFRVKAYGQDPTWTVTSFDASVVEQALGLEAGFIPAIADGTKFSLTQTSDSSIKVTVESGANYSNFITALTEAGFEETSAGSNVFVKENVTAVVSILNPITQKFSVEYTVQSSPAPEGEWPLEQIAALLGDTRAAYLPEAEGATSVIVTGSEGDCTISITGVSAGVYKQALLDAGFYFDGMSYSKSDLYVDVTGSGDNCTVNAYYWFYKI